MKKNTIALEKIIITVVPIDSILPNDYNPNRQSERDFELLCRSIEEDGYTQPIIVRRDSNKIVDGEHRWRACKVLGWTEIPIVYVDMTDEQAMIATLRHNRAKGTENINLASGVLKSLQAMDYLDQSADSLMLDNIDLQIMLEDIPQPELVLRNPTEKMTYKQTMDMLGTEKAAADDKTNEDTAQGKRDDHQILTMNLTISYAQKKIIEMVTTRAHATGIIKLCNRYKDSEEAKKVMDDDGYGMGYI